VSSVPPSDSTRRFSDRVRDYVRHRPDYPEAMAEALRTATGLEQGALVADVGSGTGISAQLLLRHGFRVVGVEPNEAMRGAAEAALGRNPRFRSVDGTAEHTTLPPGSVDMVAAGQAFHWFRRDEARREFARVLRPEGWVALFWNTRRTDSPFLRAYEELLHAHATDYREVDHRRVDAAVIHDFFGGEVERRVFPNQQRFHLEELRGRLLSSSYAPPPEHRGHRPMLRELERLFQEHQREGVVHFLYDTELFFGRLRS
jgi:SAM-dependent methyltransferase